MCFDLGVVGIGRCDGILIVKEYGVGARMGLVRSPNKGRSLLRCCEAWKPVTYSASHVEAVTKRWSLE